MQKIKRILTLTFLATIALAVIIGGFSYASQPQTEDVTIDFELMLDQRSVTIVRGQSVTLTGTLLSHTRAGRFVVFVGDDNTEYSSLLGRAQNVPDWIGKSVRLDVAELQLVAQSKGTFHVFLQVANDAPIGQYRIVIYALYMTSSTSSGWILGRSSAIETTITA